MTIDNHPDTRHPRVLVTGSREWWDAGPVRLAIAAASRMLAAGDQTLTIVHGAARGLDSMAASVARHSGHRVEAYPAQWDVHGRSAGPKRNDHMISLGADLVLAFPMHRRGDATGSRGTWHCAEAARRAGLPVLVVWDGALWADDDDQAARDMLARQASRVGGFLGARGQLGLLDAALPF